MCLSQNSVPIDVQGKGYVFTPVCHSVHMGNVCLSACWDTPPSRHPPGKQTPIQEADTPGSRQLPRQTTPPEADTPTPPEADTPPGSIPTPPPGKQTPRKQTLPPMHAGRYGQQGGGTHPIGMHTCLYIILLETVELLNI